MILPVCPCVLPVCPFSGARFVLGSVVCFFEFFEFGETIQLIQMYNQNPSRRNLSISLSFVLLNSGSSFRLTFPDMLLWMQVFVEDVEGTFVCLCVCHCFISVPFVFLV